MTCCLCGHFPSRIRRPLPVSASPWQHRTDIRALWCRSECSRHRLLTVGCSQPLPEMSQLSTLVPAVCIAQSWPLSGGSLILAPLILIFSQICKPNGQVPPTTNHNQSPMYIATTEPSAAGRELFSWSTGSRCRLSLFSSTHHCPSFTWAPA
jgi:hypothetical protein